MQFGVGYEVSFMASRRRLNLLIVNQHGENRGDEAAFKAMVRSFSRSFECDVAVVGQFRAQSFEFPGEGLPDIRYLNMVMPISAALALGLGVLSKCLHLPVLASKNSFVTKLFSEYRKADIVISGPGGPYFGDIYGGHEPVHWIFVFIGHLFDKPLYLYAPSAGPFENKLANIFRRRIYGLFRFITCRETRSAEHIQGLSPQFRPVVTADSALQESALKCNWRGREDLESSVSGRQVISISILDYKLLDANQKGNYENAVLSCIRYLDERGDFVFLFLPQLFGGHHSDVPYLKKFIGRLPNHVDAVLLDHQENSDMHRSLIAESKMVVASRYHPQIFSASARVPFIAICYQHKSSSFMKDIGMADLSLDIRRISDEKLCGLAARCLDEADTLCERIGEGVEQKESLAAKTTALIADDYLRRL